MSTDNEFDWNQFVTKSLNISRYTIKKLLYKSGCLRLYHQIANRLTMTVVMLHRILPPQQACQVGANPLWTMSPEVLHDSLLILKKYYNIICLKELMEYFHDSVPLPPRALLLTFDDGWADNYDFALPVLIKLNCPALLFTVVDAIGRIEPFWQELLHAGWKLGLLSEVGLSRWLKRTGEPGNTCKIPLEKRFQTLIRRLENCSSKKIVEMFNYYTGGMKFNKRSFLTAEQLIEMKRHHITIGIHGYHHEAMESLNRTQVTFELSKARQALSQHLGLPGSSINCLSFPLGSYGKHTIEVARKNDFPLIFTSDPVINQISKKPEKKQVWGRIVLDSRFICESGSGKLNPADLIRHLIFHKRQSLVI